MSSDYFANNQGTIQLQFCLYTQDNEDFTNASTGYAYKIHYTIAEKYYLVCSRERFYHSPSVIAQRSL